MNRRQLLRTLGSVAVATSLASPLAAFASESDESVSDWIEDHSVALESTDPRAELEDLLPLRRSIGSANVVGLGESAHGAGPAAAETPSSLHSKSTSTAFHLG